MEKLVVLLFGILCAADWNKVLTATVPSPAPSIDIFLRARDQVATNQSAVPTTTAPSIPQRIHASFHNVIGIAHPIWGSSATAGSGTPTLSQAQQQQNSSLPSQTMSGATKTPEQSQGAQSSPYLFPVISQAIHSTIGQISTLALWPFGPATANRQATVAPSKNTTIAATSATSLAQTSTTAPSTAVHVTPPQKEDLPPSKSPPFPLPPIDAFGPPFQQTNQTAPTLPTYQSIPDRIHNRIHSILSSYIRLPNFSQIGQNRPPPRITEPAWVAEVLGPTLEPITTRAPTFSERVQNTVQNVLLFVPATLLNVWYDRWGTREVNRVISQLQQSTPRPGSPPSPAFAPFPEQGPNPFANFTGGSFGVGNNSSSWADLPAILAFLNNNGTLTSTIVHPVVNVTANTIEYQFRSEDETKVLWKGALSNDAFFGSLRRDVKEKEVEEYDEYEEDIPNTLR